MNVDMTGSTTPIGKQVRGLRPIRLAKLAVISGRDIMNMIPKLLKPAAPILILFNLF